MHAFHEFQNYFKCEADRLPENKLHDLGICNEALPVWPPPKGAEEVIIVHEYVNECVGQQGNMLQGLCICQPEKCHWDDSGMMKNMQKAERLFLQTGRCQNKDSEREDELPSPRKVFDARFAIS